ncbi:MAG: RsmB/NOP family class I SAM-dependent RNA methyltransferase [Lachnospiraceae bacterium]|nr:RsmB/NOP family class I SAM-dependent RNA methyltransferase [Lachnospiraceae bacterium]
MRELPQAFCEKMQKLLGEEYDAYRQSMEQNSYTALRINTNKVSIETWDTLSPFRQEHVPWTEKGRYYDPEQVQPSKHPYYFAGLYYIQEPSAMIPASLLPVQPGDRVLDLCAAPGGKATEIAAKLQGQGMLLANDISVSRTMALAKNLQTAGVINAVVTAETPAHLAEYFPEYFDALLIDAPCSGEGMFRRDPHMINDWLEHGPEYYAGIQKEILQNAYQMLRCGGYMLYSTCTFSEVENEEMIAWFLAEYPDMQVCPVEHPSGFASGRPDLTGNYQNDALCQAVRIFPHRAKGEGHFAVLLQKGVSTSRNQLTREHNNGKERQPGKKHNAVISVEKAIWWLEWLGIGSRETEWNSRLHIKKNQIIFAPDGLTEMSGLRLIQSGLIVGTVKGERFEPSPQLALAAQDISRVPLISFASDDIRVLKYLKGETVESAEPDHVESLRDADGYVLVCVDGFPLGWAKWTKDGRLKNKYYAGWRMQ